MTEKQRIRKWYKALKYIFEKYQIQKSERLYLVQASDLLIYTATSDDERKYRSALINGIAAALALGYKTKHFVMLAEIYREEYYSKIKIYGPIDGEVYFIRTIAEYITEQIYEDIIN